ncbi:MAG: hypothetical protein IIZ39_02300 [Blautia sp.]|nr:hypothetical protein [Blautia sp.]
MREREDVSKVYRWTKDGFIHTSIGEALQENHPLLVCAGCGGFIRVQRRGRGVFFEHQVPSSLCEGYIPEHREQELPLRIRPLGEHAVTFEVGLLPTWGYRGEVSVIVHPAGGRGVSSLVSLRGDGPTYVPAGSSPAELFRLAASLPLEEGEDLEVLKDRLREMWPLYISGIQPEGSLFSGDTGHLLLPGEKVLPGRDYLLLTTQREEETGEGLSFREVFSFEEEGQPWYLYAVRAEAMRWEAGLFFWKRRVLLSLEEGKITPLWPPMRRQSFGIVYEEGPLYFYAPQREGKVGLTFDLGSIPAEGKGEHLTLYPKRPAEEVLRLDYRCLSLWHASLDPLGRGEEKPLLSPRVFLWGEEGEILPPGEYPAPPTQKVTALCEVDGRALLYEGGHLLREITLPAGERVDLSGMREGRSLVLYSAGEKAASFSFRRARRARQQEEKKQEAALVLQRILPYVANPRGKTCPVPEREALYFLELSPKGSEEERILRLALRRGRVSLEAARRMRAEYLDALQGWQKEEN